MMGTTFIYRTLPHYLNALRQMVGKVGRKKLFAYEDSVHRRIGFQHTINVHCLDVKTVRNHYDAVHNSSLPINAIVKYYVKDISTILHERDKLAN